MSWRCRLGLHRWTAWSVKKAGVRSYYGLKSNCTYQDRVCVECNKFQVRYVR